MKYLVKLATVPGQAIIGLSGKCQESGEGDRLYLPVNQSNRDARTMSTSIGNFFLQRSLKKRNMMIQKSETFRTLENLQQYRPWLMQGQGYPIAW